MNSFENDQVLTGIVSPAGWDDSGHVIDACVASDDGTPFFLWEGTSNVSLLEYLGKYVCVRGLVFRKGNRNYVFPESVCDTPHPDY